MAVVLLVIMLRINGLAKYMSHRFNVEAGAWGWADHFNCLKESVGKAKRISNPEPEPVLRGESMPLKNISLDLYEHKITLYLGPVRLRQVRPRRRH